MLRTGFLFGRLGKSPLHKPFSVPSVLNSPVQSRRLSLQSCHPPGAQEKQNGRSQIFTNRTVWVGDNLHVMRGINSDCIDLIYLDPPFNSNQDYAAPIGSIAAGAAFKDTWTLSDIDVHEHGELADRNPAAYSVIEAARNASGKGMMSYLIMMAVRLIEMERILKPTGSIYLHCDPTASHYLKLILDGRRFRCDENYRNDITVEATSSHNDAKGLASRNLPNNHDILYYRVHQVAKQVSLGDPQFVPHDPDLRRTEYLTRDVRRRTKPAG